MGIRIGMPILKLDNNDHFTKKSQKNSGNARAVAMEALEERISSDPDINRDLTEDNIYADESKFTSGEELCDYWDELASQYRVIDKNGKEKKLRSDAGIGFAGVIKPDMESMQSMTEDEQMKLLEDAWDCMKEICEKRGLIIDAAVLHVDELVPHIHYFGHDPEYKLGDKFGLPYKKALNKTEFPVMMRAKGWDVEDLNGYQEDTEGMSEEELEAYKQEKRKNRKHGLSSKDYKNQKKLEERERQLVKQEQKADRRLTLVNNMFKDADEKMEQAEVLLQKAEEQAEENDRVTALNAQKESELHNRTVSLNKREKQLKKAEMSEKYIKDIVAELKKRGKLHEAEAVQKNYDVVKKVLSDGEDIIEKDDRQQKPDGLGL